MDCLHLGLPPAPARPLHQRAAAHGLVSPRAKAAVAATAAAVATAKADMVSTAYKKSAITK
jgi:hypothetical protein